MTGLRECASWWAYAARWEARALWDRMPGPWWARVVLLTVWAVMLVTPGPDELVLGAVLAWWQKRNAMRNRLRPISRKM